MVVGPVASAETLWAPAWSEAAAKRFAHRWRSGWAHGLSSGFVASGDPGEVPSAGGLLRAGQLERSSSDGALGQLPGIFMDPAQAGRDLIASGALSPNSTANELEAAVVRVLA